MRRADRLFHLLTLLKDARGRAVTAATLAAELELSVRTIYRDIAHLQANGLPIDGEAGVGYRISPALTLPPVTFTLEQIEAVAVGIRAIQSLGDPALAAAGRQALDKIRAVLSPAGAEHLLRESLHTPLSLQADPSGVLAAPLRRAIRERLRTHLTYQRPDQQDSGEATGRWVRPLELACFGSFWMLAAWCEHRSAFRHFRLDRITALEVSATRFPEEPGRGLPDYLDWLRASLNTPP
ncbi:helix-turn-helix transcriptional regulator [Novispirillum itersonii]|uniref:Putative DNA-binding transcriptional regulator YafY n=1 Tax=Novispirillum itersonii TaxID=189 RepID=A0A7W9ZHF6_NOVIT|nr:YafY family protein [Novispirillum itersonii]MBB6211310.1 putative DNA-binding transcriptional regulator YafY [Novispirillum itersonii]